ncbi:SDR family NAD(P)-dependent oxidoreductase [Amycolatopsis rhabdoformis]|uniref:SDR family NAD(P)-dependent oxidoreductase n=1 Tax=Amycolatopsis rhabdoformis TaxID=1448059 RepID=A0ABZ1I6F5_9PSEU|nr:SDR family NAD(P)-dependent oxidoreductase [Amycolatopsis rhabdoformis]WSE29968.1 SDR family NAD(P)-dependent oxidoreductase [Amycolatopsis rhabdoformis]
MSQIVLVTGASSDLGAAIADALAGAGHTVYAGIGPAVVHPAELLAEPSVHGPRLRPISLDVADQRSVSTAVESILAEAGRIDAVVHAVGPVPRGPLESFTPYQLAQIYDAHVLSTQRVNRCVLPRMRERQEGLLVWVVPANREAEGAPYLALHSEAVTMIDHLAASYARELTEFGVETTIVVVPGLFAPGAGPAVRTVHPDDAETVQAYEGRYPGLVRRVDSKLAEHTLTGAEVAVMAQAIAAVVGSPQGSRPLRIAPDRHSSAADRPAGW